MDVDPMTVIEPDLAGDGRDRQSLPRLVDQPELRR
jgi:hypothetical protein